MNYRTEFRLKVPGMYDAGIDLALTTQERTPDLKAYAGLSTLVIRTGAGYLQTYLTSDELRQLGKAAFAAAVDLDAMRALPPIPAGEATESNFGVFTEAA
jgi:hypothetical protein